MASRKITECFAKRWRPDSSAESSYRPASTDYRPASFSEATASATDSTDSESYTRKGKHKFGYNASWEDEFKWLKRVDGGMLCTICNKFNLVNSRNKTGVWASEPCKQLRKDKVVQHARSEMHATAAEKERLAIASTSDGGIAQAFQTTVSLQKKAISGSMRILYWLAKEEVAHFTKFDSLRQLCLDLGCGYFRELNMGGNAKYNSHRTIEEWLMILSNVIEEDLLKQVQLSPAIGLMCDESTDISVTKELILYARIIAGGEVSTHFLKLIHIQDGKAETIEKALISFLDETNIPISNVTAFGSDGANVMVGRVSGVATRLKRHNPQILSIHCINHRLALGTSQAAAEVPYLVKFQEILVNIFKFYHYSATRQSAVAEIQSILNDPQLKFKEPKSVRWLSHALAINAIKRSLPSLLCSLEREASEQSDPTAMGLTKLCKTYMFIATLLFMSDILSHVTKISLLFQRENVDYSQVQQLVGTCIEAIKELATFPGPAMLTIDTVIERLVEQHHIEIAGITDSNKQTFDTNIRQRYCLALEEHLERRFPDLPIIHSFQVFDPTLLPKSTDETQKYGESYISELSHHYGIDDCTAQQEWVNFRLVMKNTCSCRNMEATDVLRMLALNETYQTLYPILSKFAQIALALPVSNADSERGFSCMNRVKTQLRNRLTVSSLDTLLRISIEGPDISHFDFSSAVTKWSSLRNRRIFM